VRFDRPQDGHPIYLEDDAPQWSVTASGPPAISPRLPRDLRLPCSAKRRRSPPERRRRAPSHSSAPFRLRGSGFIAVPCADRSVARPCVDTAAPVSPRGRASRSSPRPRSRKSRTSLARMIAQPRPRHARAWNGASVENSPRAVDAGARAPHVPQLLRWTAASVASSATPSPR
jgi:hypothetical protein